MARVHTKRSLAYGGNRFAFFRGKAADAQAVSGGGGIKGTILINTTDQNDRQAGQTIGTALEQVD